MTKRDRRLSPGPLDIRGCQHTATAKPSVFIAQVGQAVVRAAAAKGRTLRNPHAYGVLEAQAPGQRAFRLDVSLDFPQVLCMTADFVRNSIQNLPRLATGRSETRHCSLPEAWSTLGPAAAQGYGRQFPPPLKTWRRLPGKAAVVRREAEGHSAAGGGDGGRRAQDQGLPT